MSDTARKLRSMAARRMGAVGLDWNNVQKQAKQVVVFGSYAMSVNRPGSDLDVLCIGEGPHFKSPQLHIVWIPEHRTHSRKWLRSELATHVAAYGKWIKGHNTWAHITKPSLSTVIRKKGNVIARLNALQRHWDDLLPSFQNNQLKKLRRDIQRFQMMRRGLPPVPKTLLDKSWKADHGAERWLTLVGTNSSLGKRVMGFLVNRGITDSGYCRLFQYQFSIVEFGRGAESEDGVIG